MNNIEEDKRIALADLDNKKSKKKELKSLFGPFFKIFG
jgi:hypothetical protein